MDEDAAFIADVIAKADAKTGASQQDDYITRDELREYVATVLAEYHAALMERLSAAPG